MVNNCASIPASGSRGSGTTQRSEEVRPELVNGDTHLPREVRELDALWWVLWSEGDLDRILGFFAMGLDVGSMALVPAHARVDPLRADQLVLVALPAQGRERLFAAAHSAVTPFAPSVGTQTARLARFRVGWSLPRRGCSHPESCPGAAALPALGQAKVLGLHPLVLLPPPLCPRLPQVSSSDSDAGHKVGGKTKPR